MIDLIDYIKGFRKTSGTNYFDYPATVRKTLLVEAVRRANEMQLALAKNNKSSASNNHKQYSL